MERKYDLTKGDVFQTILMFMLPILAGNVFQQLYSAVDTIIVGRTLGSDALASVGSIGSLQFFVFGFCSGLAGGVTVVTSQFIGAGKTENARRSTAVIYMIWAVVSLLCTVVGIVCLPGLLHILNMPEERVERLADTDVDMLEINVSCPNVKEGGVAFGVYPDKVYEVVSAAKAHCTQPLVVKLTPNTADITATALAAEKAGADAISLINTLTGMAVDFRARRPILANVTGGLSGPAVKPVALRMVYQVAQAVSVPVIGMGGIDSGLDALEFMLCGASAVQVGMANLYDPYACVRIAEEMEQILAEEGLSSVQEIIGQLRV